MLGIRLFGYLEAVKGKEPPIRKFRSRSAGEVLAYLSVAMPRPVSREEVAATIWPEDEPDQARSSLRTALYSLRKQLGLPDDPSGPLGGDRQYVWLNPRAVETDLHAFQELIDRAQILEDRTARSGELQRAIGMVRGPLLEGLEATWTLPHQLAFEESYCNTVTNLIEGLTEGGSAALAVEIGRAALKVVPLREDIHVALIRSLGVAGRSSEALRQFEVLEELLLDHWGEYPSEQAVDAIEQLGRPKSSHVRLRSEAERSEPAGFETSRGWIFGRDEEISLLLMALQANGDGASSVLSIVGTGGSGKTLLAHAVGERMATVLPVKFVELAAAREVRQVVSMVARSLDLPNPNAPDALERVRATLAENPILLILDNAEHLMPSFSGLLKSWVVPGQATRILVTSRSTTGLAEERAFHISPLKPPTHNEALGVLAVNPCIEVFVTRAREVDPTFEFTPQNAVAVAEICRAMDGLPLAIQLAASHSMIMTPAQILKRLEGDRFRVVSQSKISERHASLDRVARWSYDLLTKSSQSLFRRLGAIRGDFGLDLAEALGDAGDVHESLQELVRASLVERTSMDGIIRFRMLIPLRSFALERLQHANEEHEVRERLRNYCLDLSGRLRWEFLGANAARALDDAEREHHHFRQMVDHCIAEKRWLGESMRICFRLGSFIIMRRHHHEWCERITAVLNAKLHQNLIEPVDLAIGLTSAGQLSQHLPRSEDAIRYLRQALAIFEELGNPINIAGCLNLLALALIMPSDIKEVQTEESCELLERASALLDCTDESSFWTRDQLSMAILSNLAANYRLTGRNEEAVTHLRTALSYAKRSGAKRVYPILLLGTAHNLMELERFQEGLQIAEEAGRSAEATGATMHAVQARIAVAWGYLLLGRYQDAAKVIVSEWMTRQIQGNRYETSLSLYILACAAEFLGHNELARQAYDVAQRTGFEHGVEFRHIGFRNMPDWLQVQTVLAPDLEIQDPLVKAVFDKGRILFGDTNMQGA